MSRSGHYSGRPMTAARQTALADRYFIIAVNILFTPEGRSGESSHNVGKLTVFENQK